MVQFTDIKTGMANIASAIDANFKKISNRRTTTFTTAYGITGTLTRTGDTVEWIANRVIVSGGSAHDQVADAVIPVGYRPINRAYQNIFLTNAGDPVATLIIRVDSGGQTYLTNAAWSRNGVSQGFATWKTDDA